MISIIKNSYQGYLNQEELFSKLHSLASLLIRVYIAQVFFSAGLTKITDWETTLFLFEEEYQVPLISFELAAVLGTVGELILPVLLIMGLFTRLSALGLFTVNAIAVVSLPEIAPAALYLHYLWGVLLVQVTIYGSGVVSIDHAVKFLTQKIDERSRF